MFQLLLGGEQGLPGRKNARMEAYITTNVAHKADCFLIFGTKRFSGTLLVCLSYLNSLLPVEALSSVPRSLPFPQSTPYYVLTFPLTIMN